MEPQTPEASTASAQGEAAGENFDTSLPGSTVAVPPLWTGDGFRAQASIPAPPPRKPPPLRNSTIAPWVLAQQEEQPEYDEAQVFWEGQRVTAQVPEDFYGSEEGTPRSGDLDHLLSTLRLAKVKRALRCRQLPCPTAA